MNSRRGRPKKSGQDSRRKGRAYWFGEVSIDQGWAWLTELVGKETVDGNQYWEAFPLCLGREDDIVPVLKDDGQIPEGMHPRQRALLESILETRNGRIEGTPGEFGLQRRGNGRALRYRQKDIRRLKARESLSLREAHRQGKGLFGRGGPGLAEKASQGITPGNHRQSEGNARQ